MKKLAQWLFEKIGQWSGMQKILCRDREKMKSLYPGESVQIRLADYYVETLSLLMKIVLAGVMVAGVLLWCEGSSRQEPLTSLSRNEYGEGSRYVSIVGYGPAGMTVEKELEIQEREYSKEEILILYQEILLYLEKNILGNNQSLQMIDSSLELPEEVKGFPFQISWNSSDKNIIGNDGKLQDFYREEKAELRISAKFEYDNFEQIQSWDVTVLPSVWTKEQIWNHYVEKELQQSDEETMQSDRWILPEEVEGQKVTWQAEPQNHQTKVLILTLLCAVLVVWGRNNDLCRKIKQRNEKLEQEYCQVVTKLVLYLGAGMTIRSAWKRTTGTLEKSGRDRVAVKEMKMTCREMESGLYESACYENFGKRCGRQEYIRLGTLLSQNLRKGSNELLGRLREERKLSGENRKHLIKRKGEEAATKLLGPMMLLLGMTMVLIMLPAFAGIG
ncbi:MAG: hypothetical protein IJ282_03130 [Lachnospiraceae bacterium]|nr:hypothetical protein [Lachnospiraceae bacterium]